MNYMYTEMFDIGKHHLYLTKKAHFENTTTTSYIVYRFSIKTNMPSFAIFQIWKSHGSFSYLSTKYYVL